jgi:pimeloyl-ACP methyl ester carboxylesterase
MKKRWFVRIAGVIAAVILLAVVGAWFFDVFAMQAVSRDYPPPGQFVQVGDSKMHYICQGSGEPTLVLEAGFDGGALDWMPVMPYLAQNHRVCAFDRLGQDWSDAAPEPRTFAKAADELHTALQALNTERPIVVGHSLGGAVVQIYASKYPVRGIVLVEGLTTDLVDPVTKRMGTYQSLTPLGQLGLLRPLGSILTDAAYSSELRAQMIALRSNSEALYRLTREGAVAAASAGDELRAAEQKYNAPLLAIGAEKGNVPELPVGAFANALKALTSRKPNATFVLIPNATHYVQAEYPAQVSAAIENWMTTIAQ